MPYTHMALWAAAAGGLIPVMGSLSAGLSRTMGDAPAAVSIFFLVALTGAVTIGIISRSGTPDIATLIAAPSHLYLGGFILAFYVLSVTHLIPRFGVGNTIMFAVTAQIVTSAAMDMFGILSPLRHVGLMRFAGIACMLIGLAVTQLAAARNP